MKLRNIFSLILCLAMTVTVLSACSLIGKSSLPSNIDENGRFVYTIVRGEESSSVIEEGTKTIRTALRTVFDCKVTTIKDSVSEPLKYEILVGNTNRPESEKALKILNDSRENNNYDFIVTVINEKICIQAITDGMVSTACDWFVQTFCKDSQSWQLLKNGYEFLYQPDIKVVTCKVADKNLGLFTIVKPVDFTYIVGNEVDRLMKFYKNNGFDMKYIEEIDAEEEYELLVGDTSREASKSVIVEGDNYVIKVVGKKLVVKGGSELATYRAMKHLVDLVEAAKNGEEFNWTDGYVINGKYEATEESVYTLNFNDEFETSAIDLSVWGDYNSQESRPVNSSLGGTTYLVSPKNTSSGYTEKVGSEFPYKLAYQADGSLRLAGMKIGAKDFACATASTYHSMLFKYGILEARVKMPEAPLATALWLNGAGIGGLRTRYGDLRRSCMTEIDIYETFGSTTSFASNIHRWWTNVGDDGQTTSNAHNSMDGVLRYNTEGNNKTLKFDTKRYGGDLTDDFHTYSMYWDEECIKFAFDGKVYVTYNYTDEMSVSVHKMLTYIIISAQMCEAGYGSSFKEGVHPEYAEVMLDYIRIYQTDEFNSQMATSWGQWESGGVTEILYKDNPVVHAP